MNDCYEVQSGVSPTKFFAFFFAFVVMASALYGVRVSEVSHAVERHGAEAEVARRCVENGKNYQLFVDPTTGHYAETACIPEQELEELGINRGWAYRIVKMVNGVWEELTAFVEEGHGVAEAENYMTNGGYMTMPK